MSTIRNHHFPYMPMRVSYKKKLRLEDLTPKCKKNLVKEVLTIAAVSGLFAIALVTAVLSIISGEKFEDS